MSTIIELESHPPFMNVTNIFLKEFFLPTPAKHL